MPWQPWAECRFDKLGNLDLSPLSNIPESPGVYAIATRTGNTYHTHYVGRSKNSVQGRLHNHLTGEGNKVIQQLLEHKQANANAPLQALYVSYITTPDHKLVEATYIDAEDRPLGNINRARLPRNLRHLTTKEDRPMAERLEQQEDFATPVAPDDRMFPWQQSPGQNVMPTQTRHNLPERF